MLLYYINKVRNFPPEVALQKLGIWIKKKIWGTIGYGHDFLFPTYSCSCALNSNSIIGMKYSYFVPINSLLKHDKIIRELVNLYMNHYFDLLGSGWIKVFYGMKARGVEGYCYNTSNKVQPDRSGEWLKGRINKLNLKYARKIWRLVDDNYQPIDWQIDFKSGYRWSEKIWYKNIRYGHKLGVDIKVPWELARMQHLTMLAYAYALASQDIEGFQNAKLYAREFCNQILDFIACNPPRFGVNWACTMDVGIRVVNWLIAYDLFKSFGAEFDSKFEYIFCRSVYEHGKHCYENLEYHPIHRNNHYLSDIAGLLFVSAHLELKEETNRWLAFSMQELLCEMAYEFNPDGSNFEASTSYHRLSTEIMLYCAILCLALPKEKIQALAIKPKLKVLGEQEYSITNQQLFPDWFWERLEKACEFTMHAIKPDGTAPQIGDNDSGRFLKVWPAYIQRTVTETLTMYNNLTDYKELSPEADYWDEDILDHRHILGIAGVLFKRNDFLGYATSDNPEIFLVRGWLKGKSITSYQTKKMLKRPEAQNKVISQIKHESSTTYLEKLQQQYGQPVINTFSLREQRKTFTDNLLLYSYPDFGLYIYKSPVLYLAVRCGSIGQNGLGGHAHNDQLGIELTLEDRNIICDPGTYLYTPLPERRNQFRSTYAHFTPVVKNMEQNRWISGQRGLFQLKNNTKSCTLYFNKDGFIGSHYGFNKPVYRVIKIEKYLICVYDFNVGQLDIKPINILSRGYGKCEKKY